MPPRRPRGYVEGLSGECLVETLELRQRYRVSGGRALLETHMARFGVGITKTQAAKPAHPGWHRAP